MCGQYIMQALEYYQLDLLIEMIEKKIDISKLSLKHIYPSQQTIILNEKFEPIIAKFGFTKWDNKGLIVNAKSESFTTNRYFNSFKLKPAIIIASSFIEFKTENIFKDNKNVKTIKIPYKHFIKDEILFLAGFYNQNNEFIILTKDAAVNLKAIHHRSPIILDKENALKFLKDNQTTYSFDYPLVENKVIYQKL